ncbi:hypothetical protein LSAT2_028178, partial [Lamellibrachia satsuma]
FTHPNRPIFAMETLFCSETMPTQTLLRSRRTSASTTTSAPCPDPLSVQNRLTLSSFGMTCRGG